MFRACAILLLLFAAYGSRAASADDLEFFEKKIRPVFVAHCYPCHSSDAKKLRGGLKLDSRSDLLKGGENGPVVVPGNAQNSRLIEAVRYRNADLKMPPPKQGKLTDEQIADLVAWVNMGAPCPDTPTTKQPAAAKKHWAFQPVGNPSVPQVHQKKWVKTPIDAFILAKLEGKQLEPSPAADRRTLIRRATYDLTGLPPTAEEVDAFIKDKSPNAYEKLVDRLLASPHYGERWGRYWLDVARYADTKGYVYAGREETKFVQSAAYRDWVIRAFNDDLPYDQFLKLQIAADQMDAPRDALAAMGYLTMGRRFLGVVHDIIDDRIDVVMRGMQGLTVGCARCHDHKFDPIPTKDYYALYGVFAGCYERTVTLDAPQIPAKAYLEYETELKKREGQFQKTFNDKLEEQAKRFRAKTTEYLHAVLNAEKFETETYYSFVGADEVNPVVVRQWQTYLLSTAKKQDPVWAPWHAYVDEAKKKQALKFDFNSTNKVNPLVVEAFKTNSPKSLHDMADRYGKLFVEVEKKFNEGKKLSADEEELRQVLIGADSPAVVPRGAIVDMEWYFDEATRGELGKLQMEIDLWMIQSPGSPPHAVILEDRAVQKNAHVFKRGNPANKGDEVPRQFLEVLSGPDRKPFSKGSGRLEMAEAIANKNNPLTARVMVNRIWVHHFGTGLVRTPSDFGTRSEPPSHPELLDWLARYFMDNGWSVKKLHRLILLSAVYQQQSEGSDGSKANQIDPENRLLSHMNRQRLDLEAMRDSLLAVSGQLDLKLGGRSEDLFKAPYSKRRSVYGFIDRQFLPGVYRVFDFANPDMHNPQRPETTVPQQALFLMNSPFVIEQSRALAARAGRGDSKEKIRQLYRTVLQREPTSKQLSTAVKFIATAENDATNLATKPAPSVWQYGYGEFDDSTKKLKSFTALPYFNEDAWQGGATWPDAKLGWAQLTATGGHAGNDPQHAVIRRWVSPIDGTVSVEGKLIHERVPGEGIKAKIISSRSGLLKEWTVHNTSVNASVPAIDVKKSDTLDFYVSIAVSLNNNDFQWAPIIRAKGKEFFDANGYAKEWNSKREFGGTPSLPAKPMTPLEKFAQVLLLSNEFMFVD
jgi:mono/diheme cytochrome c family protein